MLNKKVSVLMSVYNAEKTLSESILSILNQSYSNVEFIIVDDGSNIETKEILKSFSNDFDNVKVITKENTGLTDSLNVGLKYCSGEYIARQDADDISHIDRFLHSVNFLENRNYDFITTRFMRFNSDGEIGIRPKNIELKKSFNINFLRFGNVHAHGSFFFKRKLINEGVSYDSSFRTAQDFDFLFSIISKGYRCGILDECLYFLRIDEKSISGRNRKGQVENAKKILVKHGIKTNNLIVGSNNKELLINKLLKLKYLCFHENI